MCALCFYWLALGPDGEACCCWDGILGLGAGFCFGGRGFGCGVRGGSGGCVKETVCGCSLQQGSPEWAGTVRGRALGCLTLVLKYGGRAGGAQGREPQGSGLGLLSPKVEHCCLVDDKKPKQTARTKLPQNASITVSLHFYMHSSFHSLNCFKSTFITALICK